jgi:hypothetical protein
MTRIPDLPDTSPSIVTTTFAGNPRSGRFLGCFSDDCKTPHLMGALSAGL